MGTLNAIWTTATTSIAFLRLTVVVEPTLITVILTIILMVAIAHMLYKRRRN